MHTCSLSDKKRPKHGQFGREFSRPSTSHPQPQTFMFQSSTVSYGGPSGVCYSSSRTRRTGADGVSVLMNAFFSIFVFCVGFKVTVVIIC